jgi:hypothetical protein
MRHWWYMGRAGTLMEINGRSQRLRFRRCVRWFLSPAGYALFMNFAPR